jgi:1-acyl-sn-glycerol-3-phosphate acyltransferase
MGVAVQWRGQRPASGLLVSNHLSYLDILILGSVVPCVFVAKKEVRSWPAFGFFAACGGTVFLDRERRASADQAAREMLDALRAGVLVVLFPEGTSTDGRTLLRFHPALLQPAVQLQVPIAPAAIAYRIPGGEERDLCYYGDVHFAPHLLRTLGLTGIRADVEFHPDPAVWPERKSAALALHQQVEALRSRMKRGAQ